MLTAVGRGWSERSVFQSASLSVWPFGQFGQFWLPEVEAVAQANSNFGWTENGASVYTHSHALGKFFLF